MPIPASLRGRRRSRAAVTLILAAVAIGILAAWQSWAGGSVDPARLTWKMTPQERAIARYGTERLENQSAPDVSAGPAPDLSIAPELTGPFTWSFIGPKPMSLFGVATTGRVTAIAADPTTSGRIFVGTAGGGVWLSSDGGVTFKPIFETQPNLAIGAIALDSVHTSPPTVYVATGEGNGMLSSLYGGAQTGMPEFLGAMLYGVRNLPIHQPG